MSSRLASGSAYATFLYGDRWTVIDFKTDRELSKGVEVYKRQVALYARAVAAATGMAPSAVLLSV